MIHGRILKRVDIETDKYVGVPYCRAECIVRWPRNTAASGHLVSYDEYANGTDRQTDRQNDKRFSLKAASVIMSVVLCCVPYLLSYCYGQNPYVFMLR